MASASIQSKCVVSFVIDIASDGMSLTSQPSGSSREVGSGSGSGLWLGSGLGLGLGLGLG